MMISKITVNRIRVGTKTAEKAPSPNSRRKVLGRRKATKKASACEVAPITRDISISRAKPAIRLTSVSPPMVPVALCRFMRSPAARGSGLRRNFGRRLLAPAVAFLALRLELREVSCREVDRIEQERREAGVGHGVG